MKKFITCSDGGCFLFGNKDFSFKLPNGFGDCDNTVLLFEDQKEFFEYCKKEYGERMWQKAFRWMMPVEGTFNLYEYDCCQMKPEEVVVELKGRYSLHLSRDQYEYPTLAIVKE